MSLGYEGGFPCLLSAGVNPIRLPHMLRVHAVGDSGALKPTESLGVGGVGAFEGCHCRHWLHVTHLYTIHHRGKITDWGSLKTLQTRVGSKYTFWDKIQLGQIKYVVFQILIQIQLQISNSNTLPFCIQIRLNYVAIFEI